MSDNTLENVTKMLSKAGFLLELRVAALLHAAGYEVTVGSMFYDLDDQKYREIDLIAFKVVNDIGISLVIECKYSEQDGWVFLLTERKRKESRYSVKHLPGPLKSPYPVFKSFPHFQREALAFNYVTFNIHTDKKSGSQQIHEAANKLPKAVVDFVSTAKSGKRVILPLCIFNGPIFTADYNGELNVKDVNSIELVTNLNSNSYPNEVRNLEDMGFIKNTDVVDAILEARRKLRNPYIVSVVREEVLHKYLSELETAVSEIDHAMWDNGHIEDTW